MDNKNYKNTPSFNTNYIAKSLNLQQLSHLSQQRKKQNIFKLSQLSNIDHFQYDLGIISSESQFNDSGLKYGKSQTLKQSIFNKTRFNIYRKNKKSKWMQISSDNQKKQFISAKKDIDRMSDRQMASSQKNNQFLKHRKQMNSTYNGAKIKTSPQQAYTSHSYNEQQEDKSTHTFVDQKKINLIANKLLQSQRTHYQNNNQHQQAFQNYQTGNFHKKYKILPSPIKVNLLKVSNYDSLNATYTHSSPKETNSEFGSSKRGEQITKEQKPKQCYEAWDYPSPNSLNRNEIVQYTNQFIIHQTVSPSNTENKLSSSKKKGKFTIRTKK